MLLDVSKGKPLWDAPRGKIIRVDDSAKKVFIDKGTRDGIKPGLTFNVFAAGWNGRAEGELKATIEVIRVEDERTSLCRVNTLYDIDGHEVAINDATPGRILRDGSSAIKEGDLIFNTFWGAHVAIVGVVEFPGYESKSIGAQMNSLIEFMSYLQRQGITVDAYTDLRDGKMVGEVSGKTNVVIRGIAPAKFGSESDESRVKAIKVSLAESTDQAMARGMFLISPENFMVVTGFRRTADDGSRDTLNFSPQRPASSPAAAGPPPAGGKNDK